MGDEAYTRLYTLHLVARALVMGVLVVSASLHQWLGVGLAVGLLAGDVYVGMMIRRGDEGR